MTSRPRQNLTSGRILRTDKAALRAERWLPTVEALERRVLMTDVSSGYSWAPVSIGAGGFVTGFVTDPNDPTIRFARTDVGNGYRWDNTAQRWQPMLVFNYNASTGTATGLPASVVPAPAVSGVESIAVDPTNPLNVYVATQFQYSSNTGLSSLGINVYKSVDGGKNFTVTGNLNLSDNPNGNYRWTGERLKVDPNNGNIVYFGTINTGMYRTVNGGVTWSQVTTGGAPGARSQVNNIWFDPRTTTSALGLSNVSSVVYATQIGTNANVYKSADGGVTWSDISNTTAGLANSTAGISTFDTAYNFWTAAGNSIYKYNGSAWTAYATPFAANGIAVNPNNTQQIFIEGGTNVAESTNGGGTFKNFGLLSFGNTLAWLPQNIPGVGRSDGGIYFDKSGTLWLAEGNEGVLTATPPANGTAPVWNISSTGIEELVTEDVTLPPGQGDHAITAVQDAQGLYINNPATFTANQIKLGSTLISDGTSLAYCPNATNYIAITDSDVFFTGYPVAGLNNSGYSDDGGKTWTKFGSVPQYNSSGSLTTAQTGEIAVSARGNWGFGSDHLVYLPAYGQAPFYSFNGGQTWTQTASFTNGGYAFGVLDQLALKADPLIPNKYYLYTSFSPDINAGYGPLWVSTDGGVTWTQANTKLPVNGLNAQLAVNRLASGDLWWVDGADGAYAGGFSSAHGVFHSTDGGVTFTRLSNVNFAYTIATGAGSGQSGAAPYTVYIYGQISGDPNYGVFRSTNGGASWDRISYYPTGLTDRPDCMSASWDTYGLVYVGFTGNSYVYGQITGAATPTAPGAPSNLSLTFGGTQIGLNWTSTSSTQTGFRVDRATDAAFTQNLTSYYLNLNATSLTDLAISSGVTYYYRVVAYNAGGSSSPIFSGAVTSTGLVLPAWLAQNSSASWNASASVLTITGSATIIADPGTDEPIITASDASDHLTINVSAGTIVHLGGIALGHGASVKVSSLGLARTAYNGVTLVVGLQGPAPAPTFSIDASSTLDLTDNDMVVRQASLASINGLIHTGFNANAGGYWNGSGIASSMAAGQTLTALGTLQPSTTTTFDGLAAGPTDVLVKYTFYGDADLSGSISSVDYTHIDYGYLTGASGWSNGDFNYDGAVNGSDYTLIDNAFNSQSTGPVASPSTVAGTTTALTLPGSPAGVGYSYSWTAAVVPAGARVPTFSNNNSNLANTTIATFYQAGSYIFGVTNSPARQSISVAVAVTVIQTITSVAVTPATVTLLNGMTQPFTATASDQFGSPLVTQPGITWSVIAGGVGGTINSSSGVYTAPASGTGTATIVASSGSISGTGVASVVLPVVSQVSLSSSFNKVGIAKDNTSFSSTGGIDGTGAALSGKLLGTAQSWNGSSFAIAAANASNSINNVLYANSQTIVVSQGQYVSIQMLATHVNGNGTGVSLVFNYTDGSSQTVTQSFSDWYTPQSYPGESKAVQMAYRDLSNGTVSTGATFYVYGYSFALNSSKTLQSITLPGDNNLNILAVDLVAV